MTARALVAMLGAALLLGSCSADERRVIGRAIEAEGPILLLGDSILVGARDYGSLSTGLTEDGWVPETVAEESRTVAWAVEQVAFRSAVPDTIVVVMGSNPGSDLGTFPDEVVALVDALRTRGADRIVWIPPYHVDGRYQERVDALLAIEDGIVEVAVGWKELADQNPHWFSGDGLHQSGEGTQALAAFIRAELNHS
jgi:lysophospholipase L1-like esterase